MASAKMSNGESRFFFAACGCCIIKIINYD